MVRPDKRILYRTLQAQVPPNTKSGCFMMIDGEVVRTEGRAAPRIWSRPTMKASGWNSKDCPRPGISIQVGHSEKAPAVEAENRKMSYT